YLLSPTVPVNVTADATGVLTVVQETQSLAAVCFRVALAGSPGVVADVNPMSKALATLGTVRSGDDLGAVQGTNPDGTRQPLCPAPRPADGRGAAGARAGRRAVPRECRFGHRDGRRRLLPLAQEGLRRRREFRRARGGGPLPLRRHDRGRGVRRTARLHRRRG